MRRLAATVLAMSSLAVIAGCIPATSMHATPSVIVSEPATVKPTAAAGTPVGPASAVPSFVRPTPTPQPTFLAYVVKQGDTLTSIARAYRTTARSIAFWNRSQHPSLDPDSPTYAPNRIETGWVLVLVPDLELDPEDLPPDPTPSPTASSIPPTAAPSPSGS